MEKKLFNIYKELNLLCVDDDPHIQEAYKRLFEGLFKHVHFAYDGEEGWRVFQKEQIDIVLSDYMMPKLNGLDMIAKIRQLDLDVPIILVTAFENIEILRKAIELNVTSFVRKPISYKGLFNAFETAVKNIITDKILIKEQIEIIKYINYQENLTLKKQCSIIKNESQGKIFDYSLQSYFKPKDALSGDSYTIKKAKDSYFIFLVDGMGKGLSASVTAMLASSFVNYQVTMNPAISLHNLIENFFSFIQPHLLDEEILSCTFIHFQKDHILYAAFSMPPLFYYNTKLNHIASNNPPLSKFSKDFTIAKQSTDFSKMLLYTDGLNESILQSDILYLKELENDFVKSKNFEEFKEKVNKKITKISDDITFLYLAK